MKVPLSWLKEYVDVDLPARELAGRLALTGTEVERISHAGLPAGDGNLNRFVIGRVVAIEPHPNADRLSLCRVDTGGATAQIVCGASNFKEGDRTAVCQPGGMLPDGRRLEAAEIRGVRSEGMLCSESELGLAAKSAGIMILPEDAPVGGRLVDYLPVSDDVLELEITPNRPDCLSVYGVAREVAAITGSRLRTMPVCDIKPRGDDNVEELVSISVADPSLCPRYGVRLIAGVKIRPSPAWLKARLAAAGLRPVNNVVDITNYVMWTIGEPMHAFDMARIAGRRLTARRAAAGEEITTIDGGRRRLGAAMLVIADGEKPVAIAGVMGGQDSEVAAGTTDILLEAANFDGRSIMETSMALGLRSESSTRFEKGLDQELVPQALAMAARLITQIAGGRLVPGQFDIRAKPFEGGATHIRPERVAALLGVTVPAAEIRAILSKLGFKVKKEGSGLHVGVPSFRADVEREIDLVEEIARVFGLELIPPSLPSGMRAIGGLTEKQAATRRLARLLAGRGLNEVITYSFIGGDFAGRLRLGDDDPRRQAVALANPLSAEQSLMRTIMLPSMLMSAAANLAQRNFDANIFEIGRVYTPLKGKKLCDENEVVAGCLCGSLRGPSWRGNGPEPDFYAGKGLVEAMFKELSGWFAVDRTREPFLHPGKAADIFVDGSCVGHVGEVHPLVLRAFDIDRPVVAFEVLLEGLIASSKGIAVFEDLITYPASFQDISVIVDEDMPAADVIAVAGDAGAPLLHSARVFDIYTGSQIGAGKKSVALNLEFRSPQRTLTDAEVDSARALIVQALEEKLGASLRL